MLMRNIKKIEKDGVTKFLNGEIGNEQKRVSKTDNQKLEKEFAQKIKDGVADYLHKTNFDGRKDNVVDIFELCEIVDDSVKEYKNEQEK